MGSKLTICEVHRQLHRRLKGKVDSRSMMLLEVAFQMGKKMDNKLRQYNGKYGDGWWKKNRLSGGPIDGTDDRTDFGFEEEEVTAP